MDAIRSSRVASGLATEQHAVAEGRAHHRAGLLSTAANFTAGGQHQVDRQVGLRHRASKLTQQGKPIALDQPGIWGSDQQINVGIGPGLALCPRAEKANLSGGDQLMDCSGHAGKPLLHRRCCADGHGPILLRHTQAMRCLYDGNLGEGCSTRLSSAR